MISAPKKQAVQGENGVEGHVRRHPDDEDNPETAALAEGRRPRPPTDGSKNRMPRQCRPDFA